MKKQRPYWIFTIIGILVLVIAFFIRPSGSSNQEFAFSLFFNLGVVILTVVIVNFLWSMVGGEPMEKRLEDIRQHWGQAPVKNDKTSSIGVRPR